MFEKIKHFLKRRKTQWGSGNVPDTPENRISAAGAICLPGVYGFHQKVVCSDDQS